MAKKPPKPPEEQEKLTAAQKRVLGGALTLALAGGSIGGFIGADYFSRSQRTMSSTHTTEPTYQESGDNSRPIRQADVDALYAKTFEAIKARKQSADAQGKKLAILIGEFHTRNTNFDALLAELMVQDAAKRLGIEAFGLEMPDNIVASRNQSLPILQTQIDGFKDKAHHNFDAATLEALALPHIINQSRIKGQPLDGFDTLHFVAGLQGRGTLGLDPEHETRMQGLLQNTESAMSIGEPQMIERLLAAGSHVTGVFGAAHVPALADALEKNGYDVMVVNAQNMDFKNLPDDLLKRRLEAFAKRSDLMLTIPGTPARSPGESLLRARAAAHSYHHPKEAPIPADALADELNRAFIQKHFSGRG